MLDLNSSLLFRHKFGRFVGCCTFFFSFFIFGSRSTGFFFFSLRISSDFRKNRNKEFHGGVLREG